MVNFMCLIWFTMMKFMLKNKTKNFFKKISKKGLTILLVCDILLGR